MKLPPPNLEQCETLIDNIEIFGSKELGYLIGWLNGDLTSNETPDSIMEWVFITPHI